MIESRIGGNTWDLKLSGAALCLHRTGRPFAVAMRREKQYVSDRGTVKETVEVKERIALDTVTIANVYARNEEGELFDRWLSVGGKGTEKPAEKKYWFCPACGAASTGNFCPQCGRKKPDLRT